MNRKKSNLTTFCISCKYLEYLEKLDLSLIGTDGNFKKYPSYWLKENHDKDVKLANLKRKVNLIIANNVFVLITTTNDTLKGLKNLLSRDGTLNRKLCFF